MYTKYNMFFLNKQLFLTKKKTKGFPFKIICFKTKGFPFKIIYFKTKGYLLN